MKTFVQNSCKNCASIFLTEMYFIKKKVAIFCSNKCQKNYFKLHSNSPDFNLPRNTKLHYIVKPHQLPPQDYEEFCYSDANWSPNDVLL